MLSVFSVTLARATGPVITVWEQTPPIFGLASTRFLKFQSLLLVTSPMPHYRMACQDGIGERSVIFALLCESHKKREEATQRGRSEKCFRRHVRSGQGGNAR